MEYKEKVALVQRMQNYLVEQVESGEFELMGLYRSVGYSKRHADRLFCQLLSMTPREYLHRLRLSHSARLLLERPASVLETALNTGFQSHEGFTRAFERSFQITPDRYRKSPVAIPLFLAFPVTARYEHYYGREEKTMEKEPMLCTATFLLREKRMLIFQRSRQAVDYWSYCEELGCDWNGLLDSIPEKLDTAAILKLPPFLVREGSTVVAAGVEVPAGYTGAIPAGYETAELPACWMLYFQTEPFVEEGEFGQAIETAFHAVESYDPARFGYAYAPDDAPSFNFGAESATGARLAFPVKKK